MDGPAFTPRRQPSPQRRTPRSPLPPATCVDVQWTFLPPTSPRHDVAYRPPVQLESSHARAELENEQMRRRVVLEAHETQEQRVLYDLLGETQRQALLDHVMAEMEAMAVIPMSPRRHEREGVRNRPSQVPVSSPLDVEEPNRTKRLDHNEANEPVPSDDSDQSDNDDSTKDPEEQDDMGETLNHEEADEIPDLRAIRDRHQRPHLRRSIDLSNRAVTTNIRWQKSAHVGVAMDLPVALLREEDENDGMDTRQKMRVDDLFSLSEDTPHQNPILRSSHQFTSSPTKSTTEMIHPPLHFATSPRVQRVRKAPYGSWYAPRGEWWQLHETQQEALAELFPDEQPRPVERHTCEPPSPNQGRYYREVSPRPLTHPDAWPSILRSSGPVVSPRVVPLIRSSMPTNTLPPSTARSSYSPRISSTFTSPPPTAGGRSDSGRNFPSRTSITQEVPLAPRIPSKKTLAIPAPDAIALRAQVLQQEIPQVYIAREYRTYLAAKGARVPPYLNY